MNTATRWQRLGFIGAFFILGSLCWSIFSPVGGSSEADKYVDVNIPSIHFSPAEVVTLQVQSIRDAVADPLRLTVCYSLASPKNRTFTGPFENFAQMVMMPPYDRLTTCQDWQVGSPIIEENYAAVLVSTVSKDADAAAFRFILRQQDEAPYSGCWLTESVQVLEQVRTPEEVTKASKESLLD